MTIREAPQFFQTASSDCQKRLFDSLVDGGASSPATATPTRFHLNPSDSGREICKEAIFSPGNGISLCKNQLRARRARRRARFLWLFSVGFSTNWRCSFFRLRRFKAQEHRTEEKQGQEGQKTVQITMRAPDEGRSKRKMLPLPVWNFREEMRKKRGLICSGSVG